MLVCYGSLTRSPWSQNFFDRAQEGDLRNRRWVSTTSDSGVLEYEDYGVPLASCNVEIE